MKVLKGLWKKRLLVRGPDCAMTTVGKKRNLFMKRQEHERMKGASYNIYALGISLYFRFFTCFHHEVLCTVLVTKMKGEEIDILLL